MNTYQTVQGDMWDSIAKQAYGTENAMDQLMRANPDLLQAAVFGAGEIVLLPQNFCAGGGQHRCAALAEIARR